MESLAKQAGEGPAAEDTDRPTSKAMETRRAKGRMSGSASSPREAAEQQGEVMVHTDRAVKVSKVQKVQKGGRGAADAATRDEADANSGLVLVEYCWIRNPPSST